MLPRRPDRSHPSSAARAGLTVVEVLLALVMISVGLLGFAGSSALALRGAGAAAREHRASRTAMLRLARLAAAGCLGEQSGSASGGDAARTEWWQVGPTRNGAAPVEIRVEWAEGGTSRSLVVRSALLC